jgi:uncharacterized protein (DUF362 family)
MSIISQPFTTFRKSVRRALDRLSAGEVLAEQTTILIKPNLINDSPPPITTPVACCEAVIQYIRECSDAEIIIGEGCGDSALETDEIFERLGYRELADKYSVKLIDLNHAPLMRVENSNCPFFPEMMLPKIVFESYLISVPVLKAHSLADITGALKNMMGIAPPKHYSGRFGSWKKAVFHENMQQSIIDLNRYRTPDLSIMDASVGLATFHLGGPTCDPPVNRIIAGFNPKEADRKGAEYLNLNWKEIGHLR